ncbi:uncharacterized protein LOC111626467 [Centruroides sculpturatus]|uniref:uncharacterized protein LOC111626467 n=1 Tax=Centruroides sculpturatus TaxID=218467 RepID=UPI000C6DE916|nr:uncharacterized protein LOC111626467 [Centruroides sculpturatus]XP_023225613.1 uncharacterized protein LOC111626467 [Centruroides sculpturatus]XP_023225614.1 uncharacterized protein LOC111626467 [Centruroides sculpturatus]
MNKLFLGIFCSAFIMVYAIVCPPNICDSMECEDMSDCQNKNGRVKKNGGFCGCCDLCVIQLYKGADCPIPIKGVPPTSECTTGLHCDNATNTCIKS